MLSTPKPKRCAGCRKPFTVSGYDSHLKQTRKPACVAIRRAEGLSTDSASSGNESPPSTPCHAFAGDYFGSYSADDFNDYDEDDEVGNADAEQPEWLEDEDDAEHDADDLEAEGGWEPPARPLQDFEHLFGPTEEDHEPAALPDRAAQSRASEQLRTKTFRVQFPGGRAGAPTSPSRERSAYEKYQQHIDALNTNPYAPFTSRMDWEIARWAKVRGPGSTAVSELLEIEDLASLLGLSYKNARDLNQIVDEKLSSGRPRFTRREVIVAGEAFEFFYRDVLECVRALYGDPEFAGLLVFAPERHYADADLTRRVYFDIHTGKWWWETQKEIERRVPGATIIPVIVSSDKTQLTVFGSKTAYPVYLTIGNLPKDIRRKPSRRGQILLAYLPTSRLEHIKNKAARRRTVANLFHACLSHVLAPLRTSGIDGLELTSGDGVTRRGHPIYAMHVGDYPEQLLVSCCKNGTCPKCDIPRDDIGNDTDSARPLRDINNIIHALNKLDDGVVAFSQACRNAGIKPIPHPFWKDLPYVNIYTSITPDILHQLYQGVVKHLLSWLTSALGPEEIDARCRRLPPNHQIRLFLKGITTLQRVTGKEHADMCRVLLGLVIGLPLPAGLSPGRLVRAVRALLDFLYLAQYPAHTSDTLHLLQDALQRFHANKEIFIQLGVREHFRIPKLHALDHYVQSIKLFGTTDNYDTQYTERLHIDFAKDAYRATNHKDAFPQMTIWLERREKILRHEAFVAWRLRCANVSEVVSDSLAASPSEASSQVQRSGSVCLSFLSTARESGTGAQPLPSLAMSSIKITKWPNVKALSFDAAGQFYGARYLRDALARFVVQHRNPSLSAAEVEQAALSVSYRFHKLPVFHKLKFTLRDAQQLGIMEDAHDVAHARPRRKDRRGRSVPGRFDTVLVNDGTGGLSGTQGYHVAQLRLVFKLPAAASRELFPDVLAPGPLAYVERFSPLTAPDPVHGLYKVTRQRDAAGARLASVVEVRSIRRSCHLFPITGAVIPREWTSSTVLDNCDRFWVNSFSDIHMYMIFF
ncbi:hypothetical protein C8Q77DRAFT_1214290 [Trametes polyzona]|nr:hypothetical protein C8Q77DRAFT_1214290 [Trametes polyzona]